MFLLSKSSQSSLQRLLPAGDSQNSIVRLFGYIYDGTTTSHHYCSSCGSYFSRHSLFIDEGGSTYIEKEVEVTVPAPENFLSNSESLLESLSSSETAGEAESLIAGMASTMQSVGMNDSPIQFSNILYSPSF